VPKSLDAYLENLEVLSRLCQQLPGLGFVLLAAVLAKRVPCPALEVFAEVVGGEAVGLPEQRTVLQNVSR
jgi:hypothetical protein